MSLMNLQTSLSQMPRLHRPEPSGSKASTADSGCPLLSIGQLLGTGNLGLESRPRRYKMGRKSALAAARAVFVVAGVQDDEPFDTGLYATSPLVWVSETHITRTAPPIEAKRAVRRKDTIQRKALSLCRIL